MEPSSGRTGRPPVTSAAELAQIGLELFTTNGFEATTLDDIAAAAGISRRTFFRYFPSKNDLVWGDFDAHLSELRRMLDESDGEPMMRSLARAVREVSVADAEQVHRQRERVALIMKVPALQAHSMLRYQAWRELVSGFVASRLGAAPTDFLPRLIGNVALAASFAAHEQWLVDADADLGELLDAGFADLVVAFGRHEQVRGIRPPASACRR